MDVVTGARVNLPGVYNVYNGGELLRWREKKGEERRARSLRDVIFTPLE